jgi:hypothetical protein
MCRTLPVLVEIGEENRVLDLKTSYVFICNVSTNSLVIITAKQNVGSKIYRNKKPNFTSYIRTSYISVTILKYSLSVVPQLEYFDCEKLLNCFP